MRKLIFICVLVLTILAVGGCEEEKEKEKLITNIAKIHYDKAIDSCGKKYMIIVKSNSGSEMWYKPENLPDHYKIDRLQVELTYFITDKLHNCGFGGNVPIIKIVEINKIER